MLHERLSSKWLMYSAQSPSGSALYWQSRMVKALVRVWDRTVWHSSHTTWMTHQIIQQHVLTISLNCSDSLAVYKTYVQLHFKAFWRWINRLYWEEWINVWNMDAEFDNKIHVGDKVKVKEDPPTWGIILTKSFYLTCVYVCVCAGECVYFYFYK